MCPIIYKNPTPFLRCECRGVIIVVEALEGQCVVTDTGDGIMHVCVRVFTLKLSVCHHMQLTSDQAEKSSRGAMSIEEKVILKRREQS